MNVSGRLPRTPNASSATSTTVCSAIPPSRLPTATPTLPDTAAATVMAISGRLVAMLRRMTPPSAAPRCSRSASTSV